jgi:hypothetical protein
LTVPAPPIFSIPDVKLLHKLRVPVVKLLNKLIVLFIADDAIVLALKIKFPHVLICPVVIEFPNAIVPVVNPFPSCISPPV